MILFTNEMWRKALLFFVIFCFRVDAAATVIDISLEYNPQTGKYINTSQVTGVCREQPGLCGEDLFSFDAGITVSGINIESYISGLNERMQAFFPMPVKRTLPLQHTLTGESHELALAVSMLSVKVSSATPVVNEWDRRYLYLPSVRSICSLLAHEVTEASVQFVWGRSDLYASGCNKRSDIARTISIDSISYGYRLEMPRPILMSNGTYTGTVVYNVGRDSSIGGLDFGDAYTSISTNELRLNFTLVIGHDLQVNPGPSGNIANLIPAGGWDAWLGRSPSSLSADLPFSLMTTGPLKVYISSCSGWGTGRCQITNGGKSVPIDIALTLPAVLNRNDEQPVQHLTLVTSKNLAPPLQPNGGSDIAGARLHFSTDAAATAQIITDYGATYSGVITITFDADFS